MDTESAVDEQELFEIVDRIEAIGLAPVEAGFAELVGALTERQRYLARIQDFDVSRLGPSARHTLRKRLLRILAHDRALRARVEEMRESLVKQAAELRLARRGAEGYRRVARGPQAAFDRTA